MNFAFTCSSQSDVAVGSTAAVVVGITAVDAAFQKDSFVPREMYFLYKPRNDSIRANGPLKNHRQDVDNKSFEQSD